MSVTVTWDGKIFNPLEDFMNQMKPKTKRLPKGPISKSDYVVEVIIEADRGRRIMCTYFEQRAEARAYVKECASLSKAIIRMFRIKYSLVAVKIGRNNLWRV